MYSARNSNADVFGFVDAESALRMASPRSSDRVLVVALLEIDIARSLDPLI